MNNCACHFQNASVTVIHVPDDKYRLPARIVFQYLLTWQGEMFELKVRKVEENQYWWLFIKHIWRQITLLIINNNNSLCHIRLRYANRVLGTSWCLCRPAITSLVWGREHRGGGIKTLTVLVLFCWTFQNKKTLIKKLIIHCKIQRKYNFISSFTP